MFSILPEVFTDDDAVADDTEVIFHSGSRERDIPRPYAGDAANRSSSKPEDLASRHELLGCGGYRGWLGRNGVGGVMPGCTGWVRS